MNLFLSILMVALFGYGVYYVFRKRSNEPDLDELEYTISSAVEAVKQVIQKELSAPVSLSIKTEERKKAQSVREFLSALNKCTHGSYSDKLHVKTRIKQILMELYDMNSTEINGFIPFDYDGRLTAIDKFDIMLYVYRQQHGIEAFNKFMEKYNLAEVKDIRMSFVLEEDEDGNPTKYSDQGHIIYSEEIFKAYDQEIEEGLKLSLDDKINMITQRVYQKYKGLGVIDELIDMNIDGIRGGTGGIPESVANLVGSTPAINESVPKRSYEAIRVFYKGSPLHMDFMSFGNESELFRIVNVIYLYAPVGQLNRYNGYKISERADNSRVVATIPNLTDSPAFFVRKFDPSLRRMDAWFRHSDRNWRMIHDWIVWCARGGITTAYTGAQGSGKTTIMRAAVSYIRHRWNIRVLEGSAFELWLRITYHWKDLLTFKETGSVSMDESAAVIKKTDGTMTIVGEAAEDKTVAEIIKAAGVASEGTWYSHHANTPEDLESSHTNALVATGVITDSALASSKVIEAVMQNIHLENVEGHRRVGRITQFHKLDSTPYPEIDRSSPIGLLTSLVENFQQYAIRRTDRQTFTFNNIFEYVEDEGYVAKNYPSERIIKKINKHLSKEQRVEFRQYLDETFRLEEVS